MAFDLFRCRPRHDRPCRAKDLGIGSARRLCPHRRRAGLPLAGEAVHHFSHTLANAAVMEEDR
jgi:hypothetical protein